jgi:hypothetical protein
MRDQRQWLWYFLYKWVYWNTSLQFVAWLCYWLSAFCTYAEIKRTWIHGNYIFLKLKSWTAYNSKRYTLFSVVCWEVSEFCDVVQPLLNLKNLFSITNVSEVLAASIIRAMRTHRPGDGGSKDLWNVGKLLPDYPALQPRRQPSSNLYTVLCPRTCNFLRPLGRLRHMWEDNIRMDLGEIGWGLRLNSSWLRIGTGGGILWTR